MREIEKWRHKKKIETPQWRREENQGMREKEKRRHRRGLKHPNKAERRIKGWGKDRTGDIEED